MNLRFKKQDLIGRGVSSAVYRGTDTLTNTPVAIKVLNPFLKSDPIVVERFRRELQIAREIQDPYIISIFDFCESDQEKFLVMELLDGMDLKTYILGCHPIPIDFIITFMTRVLSSIKNCHQRGVIHRDLKPQNLFVLKNNNPKIIDFGISRMASQSEITVAGTSLGSPEYMAPELFHLPFFDFRSDIYALGIIFFEMLTGQLPFQGDSITALYQEHLTKALPSIKNLREETPDWLIAVVEKMTAKDVTKRYQGIEEVLFDIAEKKVLISGLKKLRMKYCIKCGAQNSIPLHACLCCGNSFLPQTHSKARFSIWAPDYIQKPLKSFFEKMCGRKLPKLPASKKSFLIASGLTQTQTQQIIDNARVNGVMLEYFENKPLNYLKKHPLGSLSLIVFLGSWYWTLTGGDFLYVISDGSRAIAIDEEMAPIIFFARLIFWGINIVGVITLIRWLRIELNLVRPWLSNRTLFPVNTTLNQMDWLRPYLSAIIEEKNPSLKNQVITFIDHYIYISNHHAFNDEIMKMELRQFIIVAVESMKWAKEYKNNTEIQERLNGIFNDIGLQFNLLIGRHLIANLPLELSELQTISNSVKLKVTNIPSLGKAS